MAVEIPAAWADLIEGLSILARGQNSNQTSPLHCAHDQLSVMADPADFSASDRALLEQLGFHANESDGTFYSFRFGSA